VAYLTAAKGLVVYRNELSTPEGSLSKADNINIDEPDVITPRRGFADYANELPSDDDRVDQLLSYKGIILRHFGDVLQYENVNNTFVNFNTEIKQLDEEIRIKSQESNGNLYFTSTDGIKKISLKKALDITPDTILSAGAPAGIDVTAQAVVQEGGFLPPQSKVAYQVLFGYKDANENLILGSPSPRYTVGNNSKNISLPEKTIIKLKLSGIQDEDYVLYDTKIEDGTSGSQYMFWFNKTKERPQKTKVSINVDVDVENGTGQYKTLLSQSNTRTVYAANGNIYLGTSSGLYISKDNGVTFENKTTVDGLGSDTINAILYFNNTLFVGTSSGLSISVDDGDTFVNKTTADSLADNLVQDLKASASIIFIATANGVSKTSDEGNTFAPVPFLAGNDVSSLYVISAGTTIYATVPGVGLKISTDSGATLNSTKTTAQGLASNNVKYVNVDGTKIYVCTDLGFSFSINSGTTFTTKTFVNGLGNNDTLNVQYIGNYLYVSTINGLSVSNDGGNTFATKTVISSGILSNSIKATFIANSKLYVATADGLSVNKGITNGDYILLDLKNLSKFFIWFKRTASATVPEVPAKVGRTVVEIDLTSIILNYPATPTDTPSADSVALTKFGAQLGENTNDLITTIENNELIITDKLDGPVPVATTSNTEDITLVVEEGQLALADTFVPNVPDAFNRSVRKVDVKNSTTDDEAALVLGDVIVKNVPDAEVKVNGDAVTITNKKSGNVENCTTNVVAPADQITVAIVQEGLIASGEFCNTNVTFVVPPGVNTSYFYQVYRTEVNTASDPSLFAQVVTSDEFNLVVEKPVSSDGVTIPNTITVLDDIPEDFRASNTPLYSNALTGAGILQTNEQPPVSKDLALFKNSMFYANTKGPNFLELSLLPGVDLIIDESITITDNLKSTTFNFVGVPRTYTLTFDTKANTNEFQILKLYSAANEQKFALWTAKTAEAVEPASLREDGYEPLRVDLTNSTTKAQVKESFVEVLTILEELLQFKIDEASIPSDVPLIFENAENGSSTAPVIENKFVPSTWDISDVDGEGEDPTSNKVLVSNNLSPSLALDITARSLVRIINNDVNSPVTAQYASTSESVPGKIRLKSKQVEDQTFYIGLSTSDNNIRAIFTPDLPEVFIPIQADISGSNTSMNIGTHSFNIGDEITIRSYGTTYIKTILSFTPTHITVTGNIIPSSSISNPEIILYKTLAASKNDESPSRIYYSKVAQPEAVPIVNYLDVGSRDQAIKRIVALRDSLLVLKEDGIFVVTGAAAPNFSVRLLSSTSVIICPDSAQVLNNNLYFLSTQGVLSVNESSDGIISRQIENLIKDVTRPNFNFAKVGFGVGYENDRAYLLWLPTEAADEVATQCYRYNIFERNWTRWTIPATCGVVNRVDDTLYIGDGVRPYVLKERKNGNRTDHSDRNFPVDFSQGSHFGDKLVLGSVVDVDLGDTLVQTQYVTISYFNRLLRKLSLDVNLSFDYNSLEAEHGVSLAQKVQELINALNSDGVTITFTPSNDSETLKTQINDELIPALNDSLSITSIKNYPEIIDIIEYEAIITAVNRNTNTVIVNYDVPFVEGSIEVYKHISCVIEWQPQHFGDPSQLKQVREASVMFDQNNFYTAKLGFATDLSQNFVDIPMPGRGVGYWGYGQWGTADFYWGGDGNDSPFRTVVPREKQRCRYLTLKMEHNEARSSFRVVGVSCPIRPLSTRAYRK
jgi:hypothetical protein